MNLPELQRVRGIEGGTGSAEAGDARGNSKQSVAGGGSGSGRGMTYSVGYGQNSRLAA